MIKIYENGCIRTYERNGSGDNSNRGLYRIGQIQRELTLEQLKELNKLDLPGVGEFENHGFAHLNVEYRCR